MKNIKTVTETSRYVVISPVRNEEDYIEKTIQSVLAQTIEPDEWIIIDDGSRDNTGKIIDSYSKQYPWIRTIHRLDRGFRNAGEGVIEAFYEGYKALRTQAWDFIVKMDGDLTFERDYFERCFEYFKKDQILGIGGGDIYHLINGKYVLEKNPRFHVRGATKIYRKPCWDDIGELIKAPGWDTLDEVKANMMGWNTRSFADIMVIHHRFTGAANGAWSNMVKNGKANYICGYHPIFMLFKCIKRLNHKPYIIASIGLLYGFLSGYFKKQPQIDDRNLIDYLRKQQIRRFIFKDSIWK